MKALAAALSFALATTILAQTPAPVAAPKVEEKKQAAPADRLRKLSKRERAARTAKLGVRHQDFLSDTEPIMLGPEIDTFLTLETEAQRDSFIDDFWRRRDVAHGTTNRAFQETYYARLEVAKSQFQKVSTERAKLFLLHGPPVDVVRVDCSRLLQPIEIWKYERIPGVGSHLRLIFYKPRYSNEFRLWNPLGGSLAMQGRRRGEPW